MSTRSPSIAKMVRAGIESKTAGLRVCTVARVEAYDSARQLIDAQPLVLETYEHEGEEHVERLPVIRNVPVCFPGGGGFALLFPIAVGDTVLLVFADRSLDRWKSYGGEQHPREPRRHHLSDAIAVPGLRSFADPLPDAPHAEDNEPHAKLAHRDGVGVFVTSVLDGMVFGARTEVRLGSPTASDGVALASKVEARLEALERAFASHIHPTPMGPSGPPEGLPPTVDPALVGDALLDAIAAAILAGDAAPPISLEPLAVGSDTVKAV